MDERGLIVGRDDELGRVERFISAEGPRVLVIDGPAGIGKSTIWAAAVGRARNRGHRVLVCRPAETERGLAFAGLTELFSDRIVDEIASGLPGPRRRALDIALARVWPDERSQQGSDADSRRRASAPGGLDRTALGLAVLGSLRDLASRSPVLLAVDDLQWWDLATTEAVAFALHRLTDEPVAVVGAVRSGIGGPPVDGIVSAFDTDRQTHLRVGPLSVGSIGRLLADRFEVRYPRPFLARLCEVTEGNPFLALELTRSLATRDMLPSVGQPFPVPTDVESLVSDRIARLSPKAREAVLVVASLARPTSSIVEVALGTGPGDLALNEAIAADVLAFDGDELRTSHPLIASAVYARALPSERRRLHRRLARIVTDPEERARHLALATDAPNAAVAAALDDAARIARARGAPASAADLGELAVRSTPGDAPADRARRSLDVAFDHLAAGHLEDARMVALDLLGSQPEGPGRVATLLRLADVEVANDDRSAAVHWCEQALTEAGDDPALAARSHAALAASSPYDVERETAHARAAIELLAGREELEPSAMATALSTLATNDQWAGRGFDRRGFERALELEPLTDLPLLARPSADFGPTLMRIDEFAEARRLLEASIATALREGNEGARMTLLVHLAGLETLTGHLGAAVSALDEIRALADECGFEIRVVAAYRAQVDAMLGAIEDARSGAAAGLAAAERDGDVWSVAVFTRPLGFLALSVGDAAEAVRQLTRSAATFREFSVVEPNAIRIHADLVEALIIGGRFDEAEVVLSEFEDRARAHGFAWSVATSARCRGLLQAVRGELDVASRTLEGALVVHGRLAMPFERARTLLAAGAVHRRARRKRAAREALSAALEGFDGIGTPLWAGKARDELRRISGRGTGLVDLSPTERQVAELVAGGRSNREVADELFMSVRTVESHLSHVYGKLGVRGRTSLAAALDRG